VKPNFGGIFDFDKKSEKLEQVNQELEDPAIWNDQKRALEMGKEKKALEGVVLVLEKAKADLADASDLFEMAREEGDDDTIESVEGDAEEIKKVIEAMEFRRMFSNPAPAVPKPRTGPRCCCASTCAIASARASRPR